MLRQILVFGEPQVLAVMADSHSVHRSFRLPAAVMPDAITVCSLMLIPSNARLRHAASVCMCRNRWDTDIEGAGRLTQMFRDDLHHDVSLECQCRREMTKFASFLPAASRYQGRSLPFRMVLLSVCPWLSRTVMS